MSQIVPCGGTQPNFISDIINKSMRARDIDALFDLRYCIVDLCQLLEKSPRLTEQLTVYRGVLMDRNKFDKMRETMAKYDHVSTRGFLSTLRKPDTAAIFGSNDNNDPNKVEVLYEIDVPLGLQHIVCANIQKSSQFEDEEEILFDLDSTFELIEVVQDAEKHDRWIIRLRASDWGGLLADKYVAYNNRELKRLTAEMLFGQLLIEMGDSDKAISSFQRLLNQTNENQEDDSPVLSRIDRGIAMNSIGRAWYVKGDYHRALDWFNSAFALQREEPELTYHTAATINNKGVLLMMADQWLPALSAFEQSAGIFNQFKSYYDLAGCFGNMGTIKNEIGEYEAALDLYRREGEALRTAGMYDDHPSMAENEMTIAFVYMKQAQWEKALETLDKVKEIHERILPASHFHMGRKLFTIGVVLRNKQRYDEALDHMNRALAIYKRSYGRWHPYIVDTYNSMANLNSSQGQYIEALHLYEQAYEQFRKFYEIDEHSKIASVLNNMGQASRHLGHLSQAFDYLERALRMRQSTLGFNHPDTTTTWVNLSFAYRAQGDLNTAIEYTKRGLTIRRDKLQPEHEDLQETEELVVQLEQEILNLSQQ